MTKDARRAVQRRRHRRDQAASTALTPGPGDALVRVRAEGICGSDLNQYRKLTEPETLPAGHETAGEIVEVGEGVDPARIGQRVAVEVVGHGKACLTCWYCRQGQYRNCDDKGDYAGGGFAEYVTRNAVACYPLSDTMTWEEGALSSSLSPSRFEGCAEEALWLETAVVVLGAGNIGLTAIAAARALGAGAIIATARHAQQAELARQLGADVVLDPNDDHATSGRRRPHRRPRSRHHRRDRRRIRQQRDPCPGRRHDPRPWDG